MLRLQWITILRGKKSLSTVVTWKKNGNLVIEDTTTRSDGDTGIVITEEKVNIVPGHAVPIQDDRRIALGNHAQIGNEMQNENIGTTQLDAEILGTGMTVLVEITENVETMIGIKSQKRFFTLRCYISSFQLLPFMVPLEIRSAGASVA
jgi:hypothetical protein